MGFSIGTDVGGSFTDLWIAGSDGRTRAFKAPTTRDVLSGVLETVRMAAESYAISVEELCAATERFGHGTTIGLNALLTGQGARTLLLTTQGFGDTLEIGRLRRQSSGLNETELTDPYLRNRLPALVSRDLIIEIDERVDASGFVVKAMDDAVARAQIVAAGPKAFEAVAICTLFATLNPIHEKRLQAIVAAQYPDIFIAMSHDVAPTVGEYARMSTTAANATLGPIAGRYLSRLEHALREKGMRVPVLMMTCSGGVMPTAILSDRPALGLFSGPAGGVMGSLAVGRKIGKLNILVTDIGGTSFDAGVIADGKPIMRSDIAVAGADIRVHSVDVESIGAGGGSVAFVQSGSLHVGPRSAGSTPGPACYGRGGSEPTATDADLVLGTLDAETFLGGRMKLDIEAAHRAIHDRVAKPLGLGLIEAAWGIRQILDSRMADLLRRVTIQRGYNPRDFVLFANGGAGPSHAWALSAELGLDGFVVPAAATVLCAYGTGTASLGFTTERPTYARVLAGASPSDADFKRIGAGLFAAEAEVSRNLSGSGAGAAIGLQRTISVRFRGQTNHLAVEIGHGAFDGALYDAAIQDFEKKYETMFGRGASYRSAGYELLSVRVDGQAAIGTDVSAGSGQPMTRGTPRRVVFADPHDAIETEVYFTSFVEPDLRIDGPALIEFPGQSVVLPPDSRATTDGYGNIHVEL